MRVPFVLGFALMMAPASMPFQVHQQPGESYPQSNQADQPDSRPMLEILPESFVGCWRGIVAAPDSQDALNGCIAGPFVPELYTLCYRRRLNRNFALTFGGVSMDTTVPADYRISATSGRVQVLSSDGIAQVKLRGFIHFNESQTASRTSGEGTWSMDEQTDMSCEIKNGDMRVTANYSQNSNGVECFRGAWHTVFRHSND